MITVKGLTEYNFPGPSVVTIGTFDGVHIGHRKILERLTRDGKTSGRRSILLTFYPHPRMVLQKDSDLKLLNTIEEKADVLEQLGLDCLVIHPFTLDFSRLTAKEFVRQVLLDTLKAEKVIIGYDHRFGRNRTADIQDLQAFGNLYGFSVEEIGAQEINEISVSSTKIRRALKSGDLATANQYLGYPYMLSGQIIRGKGLGRDLGFPTANLQLDSPYKLIPLAGVYLVRSRFEGRELFGMMNIGTNPTVDGSGQHIEVHFFELEADLYGRHMRVHILERLRDEQKFDSLERLKKQLEQDRLRARDLIRSYR